MKYADIKKFIGETHYRIDVDLDGFKDIINRYVEKYNAELNPDFQRGHVWTEEQQKSFIEFMIRGGKCSPIIFNHPGWGGSYQGNMVLVDGLQRTTAILKFLENKLAVFDNVYLNDFEDKNIMLRSINFQIQVNSLKTKKQVLQWYVEINEGGTPHTVEEINKVKQMLNN